MAEAASSPSSPAAPLTAGSTAGHGLSSQAPQSSRGLCTLAAEAEGRCTWTAVPSDLRAEKGSGSVQPGDMTYFRSRQPAPRARDGLHFPLLPSPLRTLPHASVRRGSREEAGRGALLRHSSSCSSSSEPEGPWRTSSYHLLVRVFIWMRPWWRSS